MPLTLLGLQAQYEAYAEKRMNKVTSETKTWDSSLGIQFVFKPPVVFKSKHDFLNLVRQELHGSPPDRKTMFSLQYKHVSGKPEGHFFALFPEFWDSNSKFVNEFNEEETIVTDFGRISDRDRRDKKTEEMTDNIFNYLDADATEKRLHPAVCQIVYITLVKPSFTLE